MDGFALSHRSLDHGVPWRRGLVIRLWLGENHNLRLHARCSFGISWDEIFSYPHMSKVL